MTSAVPRVTSSPMACAPIAWDVWFPWERSCQRNCSNDAFFSQAHASYLEMTNGQRIDGHVGCCHIPRGYSRTAGPVPTSVAFLAAGESEGSPADRRRIRQEPHGQCPNHLV